MTGLTEALSGKGMRFRYQETEGAPGSSGFAARRISDNRVAFRHSIYGKPTAPLSGEPDSQRGGVGGECGATPQNRDRLYTHRSVCVHRWYSMVDKGERMARLILMAKRITRGDSKVAIGYVRVSTEEQSLGPEAQRSAIEGWAASRGIRIAGMFEDHGISGGAPAEKRPGLLAALDALRTHGAGLLVAAKRDRIARDTVIAAMVEQAAGRAGATLTTADGSSDGVGPEGALMRGIVDVFAAYERGVIKARTRAALLVKRGRNERTGQVPYGFALAADGVHLEANEAEQAIIRQIRALRAAGLSLRAVTAECARRGIVSRVGRPLALTQIARICTP